MAFEQSHSLSSAELTQIVLHQQCLIEELSKTVARLESQVDQMKARLDRLDSAGHSLKIGVRTELEREQAIRDALRHLDDVTYLARSRLARLMTRSHGQPFSGHALRDALLRAIQQIKPVDGERTLQSREERCYHLLRLRFLEHKRVAEVARALAISERQYYRELKAAIHKVADRLFSPCCLETAEFWQENS